MNSVLAVIAVASTVFHWNGVLGERQVWQTENGLPQNTVHALLQDRQGYIWVATEGGVARFDGFRFQAFTTESNPPIPSNDTRGLCRGAGDSIWVATAGGAVQIQGTQVKSYEAGSGLPSNDVLRITEEADGKVIAVTAAGVAQWDGKRFRARAGTDSAGVGDGRLTLKASATVATSGAGTRELAKDNPLIAAGVLCEMRDREGNLWVGTETQGLAVLRTGKFTVAGSRQGLGGDFVRCVFQTRDGTVWIGTGANGLTAYRNGRFETYTTADGLLSDVVIALGEDAQGDLLVGSPEGLSRLHGGRWSAKSAADGLADDFVRSVVGAKDGSVYVGTRHGLTILRKGVAQTLTVSDGLASDLVGAIVPSNQRRGMVWVATARGVTLLNEQGKVVGPNLLTPEVITTLHEDGEGRLWAGTQNGSLAMMDRDGAVRRFNGVKGLPRAIYAIAEDASGNLWLTSNVGVFRVALRDLMRNSGEAVAYGTADGLRVNECSSGGHPAIWRTQDKAIWFATPRGIARMSEAQARLNTVPPTVTLESVRVDDREQAINGGGLQIGPGRGRFAFEYAALSFRAPQKVRYRYRLDPFEARWIEAGTRRSAYYTNLSPGHYRFLVTARNGDGIWNPQPAELDLNLAPHLYQTWWFALLCVAGLAGIVTALYRARVRQVQARYEAVLNERGRIAREIHDTLAQGFAGVSVQLEIVSRLLSRQPEHLNADVRQFLDSARVLVRDSLNEARRAIWQLRNEGEEMPDLRSRLGEMASAEGVAPRVTVAVHGAFRPLDRRTENELLRVAQEAVRNARQHAGATQVALSLSFAGERVVLNVQDDGIGFDLHEERMGHYGITGMSERAAAVGGELQVLSEPGRGTTVRMEVPA